MDNIMCFNCSPNRTFFLPCALCSEKTHICVNDPLYPTVLRNITIATCCKSPVCSRCSHGEDKQPIREGRCHFCRGYPAQLISLSEQQAHDYRYDFQHFVGPQSLSRERYGVPFFGKYWSDLSVQYYLDAGKSKWYDYPQLLRAAFQLQSFLPSSHFVPTCANRSQSSGRLCSSILHDYQKIIFYREFWKLNIVIGFLKVMYPRLIYRERYMNKFIDSMIRRIKSRIFANAYKSIFVPPQF